jgi:hypothetical protein
MECRWKPLVRLNFPILSNNMASVRSSGMGTMLASSKIVMCMKVMVCEVVDLPDWPIIRAIFGGGGLVSHFGASIFKKQCTVCVTRE